MFEMLRLWNGNRCGTKTDRNHTDSTKLHLPFYPSLSAKYIDN